MYLKHGDGTPSKFSHDAAFKGLKANKVFTLDKRTFDCKTCTVLVEVDGYDQYNNKARTNHLQVSMSRESNDMSEAKTSLFAMSARPASSGFNLTFLAGIAAALATIIAAFVVVKWNKEQVVISDDENMIDQLTQQNVPPT